MRQVVFAVVLGSLFFSSSLMAANGQSYFGAGYHMGTYKEEGYSAANPTALGFRGGMYIADNVAIEGRYSFGLSDDTVTVFVPGVGNINVDLELESALSVFLKADLPLSPTANVYGLVGFTEASIKAKAVGYPVTVSDSDSGLSYGLGIEFSLAEDIYAGGEYIMYIDESEYDYSGINIGITRLF